ISAADSQDGLERDRLAAARCAEALSRRRDRALGRTGEAGRYRRNAMMRVRAPTAIFVAALAGFAPAQAQTYPSKPVTLVMPYQAGGGTDLMGRLLAQRLEPRLGQPVVLDYRPGGGSAIAATYVARAPGDGHTLLYATSTTMAINVAVHKQLTY